MNDLTSAEFGGGKKTRRQALIPLALAAAIIGFMMTSEGQQFCSVHALPPIHIFAADAGTGSPPNVHKESARGLVFSRIERLGTVIVSGKSYADTGSLANRGGGSERHWGFFTVVIKAPGYRDWTARNVIVWPTPCGARGPKLRPQMERIGNPRANQYSPLFVSQT